MPIAYTRRKIEHLRKQPEHIRMRAASLMTAASGVVLVVVWLTILLPLQLHFTKPADQQSEPVATYQAAIPTSTPDSAVSGAQDQTNLYGNPNVTALPSPTPFATILPGQEPTSLPLAPTQTQP